MKNERFLKDLLYQEFAHIGKALSSPKRLEILDLLTQGPKSVETLSKSTNMSVANVSKHLQTLSNARLVSFKRQGNFVIYNIIDKAVSSFINSLHSLSEKQNAQVQEITQEFLSNQFDVEEMTLEELKIRMEENDVLLLDVRPREEYENAHIPGALSIPIEELEERLALLPKGIDIIAYCRGPYCLMAVDAVEKLNSSGFKAFRLEKSVHDWYEFMTKKNKKI